jgi:hypothetical protein
MPWPTYPMVLKTTTSHEEGCSREWAVATKEFSGHEKGELVAIKTVELEGGGMVFGTQHRNTKMVDDIIDDVKSKIPKEKWKDIVFVGEGGATNKETGELEFNDEMDYAVPKFKEMGASVDTFDGDDLDVHKHCDRNCLYQEIQAAAGRQPQRDPIEKLIGQGQTYKEENYPENIGLYENGILYRKNNKQIRSFNKLWFEETAKWNTEDQVSMMYSLWKYPEVKVNALHQTFVMHNYQNRYLPLTDQFKCLPRSMRYVKE